MRTKAIAISIAAVVLASVVGGALALHFVVQFPSPAPLKPGKTELVKAFPPATFLENVAFDGHGRLYAALSALDGVPAESKIWVREKSGAEYFIEGTGCNLAFSPNGDLYSTVMSGSLARPDTLRFRLDKIEGRSYKKVVDFPFGAWINGLAFDDRGNLYAADSRLATIWRLTPDLTLAPWARSDLLAAKSIPGIPGANGIRFRDHAILVVNSSTARFLRVGIGKDGAPEKIETLAEGVPGDGFAVAANGDAYFATHLFDTLTRVDSTGAHLTVGGPENQIIGPTDVAIDPASGDVFVAQDGGALLDMIPPFVRWLFPQARGRSAVMKLRLSSN